MARMTTTSSAAAMMTAAVGLSPKIVVRSDDTERGSAELSSLRLWLREPRSVDVAGAGVLGALGETLGAGLAGGEETVPLAEPDGVETEPLADPLGLPLVCAMAPPA